MKLTTWASVGVLVVGLGCDDRRSTAHVKPVPGPSTPAPSTLPAISFTKAASPKPKSHAAAPDEPTDESIVAAAHHIVTGGLKNPTGAKFSSNISDHQMKQVGLTYRVGGFVDATNSFGATIRERWVVDMTYDAGKWTADCLRVGGKIVMGEPSPLID